MHELYNWYICCVCLGVNKTYSQLNIFTTKFVLAGQSAGSQVYPHSPHSSYNPDSTVSVAIASPAQLESHPTGTSQDDEESGRHTTRQHSTTEYLPGMLHTDSPAGLLPKFSSWSLVCVGKYCNYTHTQGIFKKKFNATHDTYKINMVHGISGKSICFHCVAREK